MTRDIFKTILLLLALLCFIFAISSCGEVPRSTHPAQQDVDTPKFSMPQAIRVIPGNDWPRWISGDSILINGFGALSMDNSNGKQVILTDTSVLRWLVAVLPDSFALSGYADTLRLSNDTLYISGQNYVLLSDYLDNTDAQTLSFSNPNLSISGGNSVDLSALSGGGGVGLPVIPDYDSLRLYDGTATIVYLSDFESSTDGDTATTVGGLFCKGVSGSEDGATIIDGVYTWYRYWDGINVLPEWWEIGGYDSDGIDYTSRYTASTGIWNESDRVRSAIDFGGTGKDYKVNLQPFKTYEIDIPLNAGIIRGGFSILKAKADISSALTAQAASGQNQVTITDASEFRVGQYIVIADVTATNGGIAYAENNYPNGSGSILYITNISGNVITLSGNLETTMNIGDLFSNVQGLMLYRSGDVRIDIRDCILDGNRQGSQVSYDFRVGPLVLGYTGSESVINFQNCIIRNTRGSAITGANIRIINCNFKNLSGGILHQTLAPDNNQGYVFVQGVKVDSSGVIDKVISSHQEAIFTFSNNTRNMFVDNVHAINTFNDVFGEMALTDDYNIRITNSVFEGADDEVSNTTSPPRIAYLIGGTSPNINASIVLENNSFVNCGDIGVIGTTKTGGKELTGLRIVNNEFINGRINLVAPKNCEISGNKLYHWPGYKGFTDFDHLASYPSGRSAFIYCNSPENTKISNNWIQGDTSYNQYIDYGIQCEVGSGLIAGTYVYNNRYVEISRNHISGVTFGIGLSSRFADANTSYNSPRDDGIFVGCKIEDNFVHVEKYAQTTSGRYYWGIYACPGWKVSRNTIILNGTAQANGNVAGVLIASLAAGLDTLLVGARIENNEIFTRTTGNNAIKLGFVAGQDRNNIVKGNLYQGALADTTRSYVRDNIYIDAGFENITTKYIIPN